MALSKIQVANPVVDLDGTYVRPDGNDAAPGQSPCAHGGRRRDEDAAGGAALTRVAVDGDEDAVVQHADRGLLHRELGDLRGAPAHCWAELT